MNEEEVISRINNLRRKMLVHSYLYYSLNVSVIDDYTFDRWAKELVKMQERYPDITAKCIYPEAFVDFDGTTGYHLPREPHIEMTARRIFEYHNRNK